MSGGIKWLFGIVALLVVAVLAIAFWPRGIKVATPESGPVVVEEPVPSSPDDKLAFDRRKAASACRVAIMQSLKDPATAEFVDPLDNTPWVAEADGDYSFKVAVRARNESGMVTRQLNCRAHQEAAGWAIAKLAESGSP
ncbi:MAG: hypothetical protein JWQ90_2326 [Hydrocarboniphaga sp.]|uniref:hypothetical protein n=1 Tax=Hydrocarboniphaga sp. TaxID=2033016 RepID=UPI002637788A|nr:hypothetical protein [Hydrocarboniphaga sp.]MDB5969876.1 hypothetical protein [Hydrocarboniphaga sp.]